MAENTHISWTDSTFNPWMGCTKVGPGCDHCYAERDMDHRYGKVKWGAGQPRGRTSAETWKHPVAWNKKPFYQCLDCGARFAPPSRKEGYVTCPGCSPHKGRYVSDEDEASRVKKVRRRVFCASLADVFDNEVDPQWRRDLFDLIETTPDLDWILLTKRVGNVVRLTAEARSHDWLAGQRNVWLGATVVNQEEADRDIPKLLAVPARVRFLSCEPLLGPIDLVSACNQKCEHEDAYQEPDTGAYICRACDENVEFDIDWVICGGESGPHARPMHPDWARSLRDQCQAAGALFFMKQLSGHRPAKELAEFPPELRVREWPHVS